MLPKRYFPTVQEFYDHIRDSFTAHCRAARDDDESWGKAVIAPFPVDSPVHFTHGDIGPSNIIVRPSGSTIVGLIDWGLAGWYPDYWEYCRMRQWDRPGVAGQNWERIVYTVFFPSEACESAYAAYENLIYNMQRGGLLF